MKIPAPGRMVIISSPSGGGKSSICHRLLSPARRKAGWRFSVSYTTRAMRKGEQNGREYVFVTEQEFDRLAEQDFFAEHFQVHLYKYGTPRKPIEQLRKNGGVMLFDVDVQGARRLHKEYLDAVTIFVLPPSIAALRSRLTRRGTETAEQLKLRFENAKKEMQSVLRDRTYAFDYVVINNVLSDAVSDVLAIIRAHRCRFEQIPVEQSSRLLG
jgi:guanylate kinase